MQGASILAVGKVYENDMGRSATSLSAGVANSKGFTDCLRKQNKLTNSSPSDDAAGTDTAGSRSAKLDRSALLRVPIPKNSRASKDPANDDADYETMIMGTDKTGISLVSDCGAVQAQPQTKADADVGTRDEPAVVEQQIIEAEGSALPLAVAKKTGSQPAMEQDTVGSSADTVGMLITVANSNAASELQSQEEIAQDSLIQLTQGSVLAVDCSEKPNVNAPQPEGNQNISLLESTELSGQINYVPVIGGKTATPAQAVAMVEPKSPDSPPPATIKAQPSTENAPAMDGQTKMSVTEAGADVSAQMVPNPEAEKVLPRLEVDSLPQQQGADRPELISQVSNPPGTVAGQPVAAVVTQPPKPAQAAKGETKSDAAGAKNALETFKAMAGKLEEPESNPTVQVDKKGNAGSGELKKLMEFESNRLQAAPLKDTSSGTSNASPVDKQAMVTVTLLPQTPAIKDVNLTQATKLSDQVPLDAKTLIDQVVQKAELTVKANSSEMKIQLEPEFLGKLTIKIAVEDGLLTARFTTENHQVKHLLESNLATLRQSLEAQGIKVEKTEVNVQLDSGGTFGGYEGGRQDMWQRPETPNYRNNSYAAGNYEVTGEAEFMEPAFSQTEYYGIQADGSMNFVV